MNPFTPDQKKRYEDLVKERGESRVKQCNECGEPAYLILPSCVWGDSQFPKVTVWMRIREQPLSTKIYVTLLVLSPLIGAIIFYLLVRDTDGRVFP